MSFSKDGRCSRIGIHEIPADGTSKSLADLTGFKGKDAIAAVVALPRERNGDDEGYLFLVTDQGIGEARHGGRRASQHRRRVPGDECR